MHGVFTSGPLVTSEALTDWREFKVKERGRTMGREQERSNKESEGTEFWKERLKELNLA